MVVLVAFFQSTQNTDGTEFIRLIHHHGLEPTFQRLILLKIFLVFVQGSSTNASQFTTCQSRLQDIGCIHGSFAGTCSYKRMDLIDEQDHASITLRHLVDDALQPFLELSFILRTGHQGTHVEREHLLVLQVLGHITTYDSLSKTFHNGGLTCTWLTD